MTTDQEILKPVAAKNLSAFGIAAALVEAWVTVARVAVLVVGAAAVALLIPARSHTASATFVPMESDDAGRSGLATIAGQFGVSIGSSLSSQQSPEFYAELLRSRALLMQVASDSVAVDGRLVAVFDLLEVEEGESQQRLDKAVARLAEDIVGAQVSAETGVVTLTARSTIPELSIHIVRSLMDRVNEFNAGTRQRQATLEREFVEARHVSATDTLRGAEDQLARFLQTNRSFQGSPLLMFEHDRLQREVTLRQQVVTALAQSLEEVQAREIRDTPVVTVIQSPYLPSVPDPINYLLLVGAAMIGTLAGVAYCVLRLVARTRLAAGDSEVAELQDALHRVWNRLLSALPSFLVTGWRSRRASNAG